MLWGVPPGADLLLVNGNVLTMDPARPQATAVAVSGGRIVGVYDGQPDISGRNVVDLKGATLIPGFLDAHNHMIEFGLTLTEVDLRVLRDAGMVEVRADAQRRLYRIRPEPLAELDDWLASYRTLWATSLDRLEEHLERRRNP